MTDELYTQTEGGIRYWTREELLSLAAEVAALKARIVKMETKNIVATEGKYARTEYMSYWTYDELLIRAQAAEAEVAALKVRIAELEAADQWRPVSEPPGKPGDCLVWVKDDDNTGFHAIVAWANDTEWEDGFVTPLYWRPLPTPPQEAPAA